MSKPNGRTPMKRLAEALKPPPFDTEELAAALTECFEAATAAGTKHVDARLDRQDETLRMMWKQCGGDANQRLPIDD